MCMTSRAAQYCLAGRMRPVGRRLESPAVGFGLCCEIKGCQLYFKIGQSIAIECRKFLPYKIKIAVHQ